jgi:hypothetical protein
VCAEEKKVWCKEEKLRRKREEIAAQGRRGPTSHVNACNASARAAVT